MIKRIEAPGVVSTGHPEDREDPLALPISSADQLIKTGWSRTPVTVTAARASALDKPLHGSLSHLSRSDRRALIQQQNIIVTNPTGIDSCFVVAQDEFLRAMGYGLLDVGRLLDALVTLSDELGLDLCVARAGKRAVSSHVRQLLALMDPCAASLTPSQGSVGTARREYTGTMPGVAAVPEQPRHADADGVVLSTVVAYLDEHILPNARLALRITDPTKLTVPGPRILFCPQDASPAPNLLRRSDDIAPLEPRHHAVRAVLRATVGASRRQEARRHLFEQLDAGKISITPKLTIGAWPRHPVVERLKSQLAPIVEDTVSRLGIACDPQDIRYQALFRLVTTDPSQVFLNGSRLGSFADPGTSWKTFLRCPEELVSSLELDQAFARCVISEQVQIAYDRLSRSSLPLQRVLGRTGIFSRDDLVIRRRGEGVFISTEFRDSLPEIPCDFRPVSVTQAHHYHQDLHYLHAPRGELAFGLFLTTDAEPFSILSFDSIDRAYKQNVLLLKGYDPSRCLDCTRLYNWPGAPKNTSSAMFALSFRHLRQHLPWVQAVLTSHMPTYTRGTSMLSGGFREPVLIKPTEHHFEEVTLDGCIGYRHSTRRQARGVPIAPMIPLLPTLDMICCLQKPRFEPHPLLEDSMVVYGRPEHAGGLSKC